MSEEKKHTETHTVNNGKIQGKVVKREFTSRKNNEKSNQISGTSSQSGSKE